MIELEVEGDFIFNMDVTPYEFQKWLFDNEIFWRYGDDKHYNENGNQFLIFKTEEDAMAFKLRWC